MALWTLRRCARSTLIRKLANAILNRPSIVRKGSRRDICDHSALVSIRADNRHPAGRGAVLWDRTCPRLRPKAPRFDGQWTSSRMCANREQSRDFWVSNSMLGCGPTTP